MNEPLSIYGKSFRVEPAAGKTSVDRKWPEPELGSELLTETHIYYSPEHWTREWREMWSRTWNLAGRVSDVTRPGDFFRFELGPESFIVIRDHARSVRAFYNVCQHRGSQLIDCDFGHRQNIVCPFHSWCWELNGKLKRVTDHETFAPSLIADNPPLSEVRCEIWGGFVFINLDANAAPLAEQLGVLPELIDLYRPEDMIVVKDITATWPMNWKIGLDAFMEGYHAHSRHPELIRLIDDYHFQHDLFEHGQSRMIIPLACKSPRFKDTDAMTAELEYLLSDCGLDPAPFAGRAPDARAAYKQARRDWATRMGLDFSHFSDSQVADDWNFNVFPNVTLNVHPESILVMSFRPHRSDPEMCHYDVMVLAHKSSVPEYRLPFYMDTPNADLSGNTPRPARTRIMHGEKGMGDFLDQDGAQLPLVQRGVKSRGFRGLRLSDQEIRLRHFYAEYWRYFNSN